MYLIIGNENFQSGIPVCVSLDKVEAEKYIVSLGFFKKGQLFVNSNGDDGGWLKIVPVLELGKDTNEVTGFINYLTK